MATGRARTRANLRRPTPNRPGEKVLIVTEGSETEPRYFKSLGAELKLGHLRVEGKHCGSAPISVVDHALELRKAARREPYDAIWCVFDRECNPDHQSFPAAIDKARANGLYVAASVPCFEFWYLLHFTYSTGAWPSSHALMQAIATHIPEYAKSAAVYPTLRPHLDDALTRAEQTRQHHQQGGSLPYANPMTDVDQLVRSLRGLKNR